MIHSTKGSRFLQQANHFVSMLADHTDPKEFVEW